MLLLSFRRERDLAEAGNPVLDWNLAMTHAAPLIKLDNLIAGSRGTVVHVAPSHADSDGADPARRLMELGFVRGKKTRVIKLGMPGGEPLAIKVGNSTFALRRFEAAL